MWDLIVSVPDHCLSFYFTGPGVCIFRLSNYLLQSPRLHCSLDTPFKACSSRSNHKATITATQERLKLFFSEPRITS